VVALSLILAGGRIALASQSSKDVEIPSSSSPTSPKQSFRFWFQITPPGPSKKDFDFRPPTSVPKAPSELTELRYLFLGNIDPDLALLLRLTDKAKERQIDPERFANYLVSQQIPFHGYLSLDDRINNLIIELCLYDLGKVSRNNFFSYLQRIRVTSYQFSSAENTFNYILDLLENYIFSPPEAIDSLFLLKKEVTTLW
jgi:hypothetical protein